MDTKKIIQALTYLAYKQKSHCINSMKAYKLLWLADRYHLRNFGRTITGDRYFAMPYGPVPSDAKSIIERKTTKFKNPSKYRNKYIENIDDYTFKAITKPDTEFFSDSDQEALDLVLKLYNKYDRRKLSRMSHEYPEWLPFKEKIEAEGENSSYEMNMENFFDNREGEDSELFNQDTETLALAKELYKQIRYLS